MTNDNPYRISVKGKMFPNALDHIAFEETDTVKWIYNTETKTFDLLNLPFFFENAPDNVEHDLIEWIRKYVECEVQNTPERPCMPESVRQFRDDPKTVLIRAKRKRGYIALEDFA